MLKRGGTSSIRFSSSVDYLFHSVGLDRWTEITTHGLPAAFVSSSLDFYEVNRNQRVCKPHEDKDTFLFASVFISVLQLTLTQRSCISISSQYTAKVPTTYIYLVRSIRSDHRCVNARFHSVKTHITLLAFTSTAC